MTDGPVVQQYLNLLAKNIEEFSTGEILLPTRKWFLWTSAKPPSVLGKFTKSKRGDKFFRCELNCKKDRDYEIQMASSNDTIFFLNNYLPCGQAGRMIDIENSSSWNRLGELINAPPPRENSGTQRNFQLHARLLFLYWVVKYTCFTRRMNLLHASYYLKQAWKSFWT